MPRTNSGLFVVLAFAVAIGVVSGQARGLFPRNGQSQPNQFEQQSQPPPQPQLVDRRSFAELPGGMFERPDELPPQDDPNRNDFMNGGFMPGPGPQNGLEQGPPPPQLVGRNAPPPPPQMREQELGQQMGQDPFNSRPPPLPAAAHTNHIVNKQAQQLAIQHQIIQDQRQMLENQANRQSRSSQSQPPGHVTVIHYPLPVVISPAIAGDGNSTEGQQKRSVTVQVHHPQISTGSGNANKDNSNDEVREERPRSLPNPREQFRPMGQHGPSGLGRERRRLHSKDFGLHLVAKPKGQRSRPSSHSKADADSEQEEPEQKSLAAEDENDENEAPAAPAAPATRGGHSKRSCLTGDCDSVGAEEDDDSPPARSQPPCNGKHCTQRNFRSMSKHRRHLNEMTTGAAQDSSADEQDQKSTVTVVAERSISSGMGGSSSNEVVCQLNNVPRADRCIENTPWKEIIKQPINCGAVKRQWRCYCGFFEE